jgi:hypothetical protein
VKDVDPEWKREPDVMSFEHAGLKCYMTRHSAKQGLGHWCGYVEVPEWSHLFGVNYDEGAVSDVEVHGGLTFSDPAHWLSPESGWWFGFDCAHASDLVPGMFEKYGVEIPGAVYRNVAYVEAEVKSLAEQLAKLIGKKVN